MTQHPEPGIARNPASNDPADAPDASPDFAGSLDFVLCRFGKPQFSEEPALSSFRQFFPQARAILYTDKESAADRKTFDALQVVNPPFDPEHYRYGWRSSDYYRAIGLLQSAAEVAIYSDSDLYFCAPQVRSLPFLARRFHFCLPANPRHLARRDALLGADSDRIIDDTGGYMPAYNNGLLALDTSSPEARHLLEAYLELLLKNPQRGPLAFHRAVMVTGFSPLVLPFQWCVCEEHMGIGDELVLHVGHKLVHDYYFGKAPALIREIRRLAHIAKSLYFPGKKAKKFIRRWKPA